MGAARKISAYELHLIKSVPAPEKFEDPKDRQAVEALKKLTDKQQAKILRILGVNNNNPFSIRHAMRKGLLSLIATVGYSKEGVDAVGKGANGMGVLTPTGGQ